MIKKLFLAIFLLIAAVAATPAQVNPEQAILKARDEFFGIKNRSIEMERMKRDANKRPDSEDSTPKFPLIKEDFEQIQKLNSEVVRLTAAKTPVNYDALSKSVAELNHRAVRLKSNLFTAEAKEKNKRQKAAEPQDINTLLAALDNAVNSFVHSSIFQNINVVNPADSLKAQKDLENVIRVSSAIKEKTKD